MSQGITHAKADTNHEERAMKDEKAKPGVMKPAEEKAIDKASAAKKKKKGKNVDEATAQKVKKVKPEKSDKKAAEPKDLKAAKAPKAEKAPKAPKASKAPKDDKLTKFLVSMKKSVRKSIKKEAAEAGVSMNVYIVLAVEEKLGKNSPESAKAPNKKS
jgi:predicted HicB family RNase H-like nuclease